MPFVSHPRPRRRHAAARILAPLLLALALLTTVAAASQARAAGMLQGAMQAVYVVHSADDTDRFLGSAFRWSQAGQVAVTNAHVVGDAAEVRLTDDRGQTLVAPVIARDAARDVAVIGLPTGQAPGLVPAPVPDLGGAVFALGAPLGIEFTATRGMVSASARQVDVAVPLRLLQHDAAVNPGSSGGPLVDEAGGLVGMNSQIADGSRHFIGIAYAIAASDLDRIVTGLVAETLPPLPRLGLHLRPVSRQIAAAMGIEPLGVLVDRVEPGSAGDRAGLMAGDVIALADGQPLPGPGDLAFAIEAAQDAGHLSLTIRRQGASLDRLLPLDPPGDTALILRDTADAAPRVAVHTLATLGVTLDGDTVAGLSDTSPAALAGLAEGDRIVAVNGKALDRDLLETLEIRAPALLLIARPGSGTRHLVLDPWDRNAGFRPQGGANVLDPDITVF